MEPRELASADGVRLDCVVHLPTGPTRHGTVVLAHGITADMDEGGMYVRLADRLADVGYTVLRFSFRGHGKSGGSQQGVTIAGEMLDLETVVDLADREYPGELSVVAASFGAVPLLLSLPYLRCRLTGLVLWNPVLDLHRTFLGPELPWGLDNFGPDRLERLREEGSLLVDGEFALGRVLFEEMRHYRPLDQFHAAGLPSLIVHGDHDSYVSFDVARASAEAHRRCEFHAVRESDHGFGTRAQEDEAIEVTVAWFGRLRLGWA